jgi:solute carrier family 25 (mitochondrial phosphate transporter), member 23/24/25/41
MEGSEEQREQRLRGLFQKLDTRKRGQLELADLKQGLQKMNHPLKNADGLVRDFLVACDLNHDGHITYDEFVRFCKQAEDRLLLQFNSIDRDHNGKLDKQELAQALERDGVSVSQVRLDRFFAYIDQDHDGRIEFPEWRGMSPRPVIGRGDGLTVTDFLLFLPTHAPNLRNILSYYDSTVKLNAEGDVHLSEEALSGLGTPRHSLAMSLFGAIMSIARPAHPIPPPELSLPPDFVDDTPDDGCDPFGMDSPDSKPYDGPPEHDLSEDDPHMPLKPARRKEETSEAEKKLTFYGFNVGYFACGAVAGMTSRTATAPLDRIRVYLIASTDSTKSIRSAAKSANTLVAAGRGAGTLWKACQDLWAAGGVRSLFAGESQYTSD